MRPNPVGWFDIPVEDMDRAKAFYGAVFSRSFTDLNEFAGNQMALFDSDPEAPLAAGALVKNDVQKAGALGTLVYFSCEDVADECKLIEANGGSIYNPKMSVGDHGYVAHAYDTEGNLIGLHSMQ